MSAGKKVKDCKVCLVTSLIGVVSLFVAAGHVWYVLDKVLSGHGLDYFTTLWGYTFSYIGALVFYIAFGVFIILSPLIYWFSTTDERSFKKKYNIDD